MRITVALLAIALAGCGALTGCGKGSPTPGGTTAADVSQPEVVPAPAPDLTGTAWKIAAVDGHPAGVGRDPSGRLNPARVNFGQTGYGGSTGCNYFGGLGAQLRERYVTLPGEQTTVICPALAGQEAAMDALFRAPLTIISIDPDTIELHGSGHVVRLAHDVLGGQAQPAQRDFPMTDLAGTTWDVLGFDSEPGTRAIGRLRFAKDRMEGRLDCGTTFAGTWGQKKRFLAVGGLQPICDRPNSRDKAFAELLSSAPRIVTGPNGEMLLANESAWAVLQRR